MHHGDGAERVRAEFAAVYGVTIDDVIAERRAAAVRFPYGRMQFPQCSVAPASGARVHVAVGCDTAVGPQIDSEPPAARAWATIDVPAAGTYTIAGAAGDGFAQVFACDGGARLAFFHGAPSSVQVALPAGRLHVDLTAYIADPATIDVSLAP